MACLIPIRAVVVRVWVIADWFLRAVVDVGSRVALQVRVMRLTPVVLVLQIG